MNIRLPYALLRVQFTNSFILIRIAAALHKLARSAVRIARVRGKGADAPDCIIRSVLVSSRLTRYPLRVRRAGSDGHTLVPVRDAAFVLILAELSKGKGVVCAPLDSAFIGQRIEGTRAIDT